MSTGEGVIYGPAAHDKIRRAVLRVLQDIGLTSPDQFGRPIRFYEGELTQALTATTNGKTGATKCKAKRWVPKAGSTSDPQQMELGTVVYDLVNRSQTLPATPIGTYCIWIEIGKEYRIVWVDC